MNAQRQYTERLRCASVDGPFDVRYAGRESCSPGHHSGGVRDHFLLHIVASGKGQLSCGARHHEIAVGGCFVLFPGCRHEYRADDTQPWTYYWVGFAGSGADQLIRGAGFSERYPVGECVARELALLRWRELCESLGPGIDSPSARAVGFLHLLVAELTVRRTTVTTETVSAPSYVDAIKRFVAVHYSMPVSVQGICDYLGLNRCYASSLFRSSTGTTIQAHVIRVRMEHAKRLLLRELPVREVASSVGYQSYHSFEKCFRRETGMSPSQFRTS